MDKRKIEVFTAGCPLCDDAVRLVEEVACASCDVEVHDLTDSGSAQRVVELGIRQIPTVVVDGTIAECCRNGGVTEAGLRAAGIGRPLEA